MEETEFTPAITFAIQFIFTILFGTAAWEKIKGKTAPEWFIKSFEPTFISKVPGGAKAAYWTIGCVETLLALAFPISIFFPEITPFALITSLYLFGTLCLGLRITGDYQGSANMFIYFAAGLMSLSLFL